MSYTETHTVKNLLEALAATTQQPNHYDAILFDGALINSDTLAKHVRGIHSTIPLICVGGEGQSRTEGNCDGQDVTVISNPPEMKQLYDSLCRVTGNKIMGGGGNGEGLRSA